MDEHRDNLMPEAPTPVAGDVVIRVEGLTAGFGGRIVLKDVSFDVYRGEILVIAGGSGSGKSTLLKQMIGLHRPLEGHVTIDGVDIHHAGPRERQALLRRFGVAYQGGALFGSLTVLENVRLPLEEFTRLAPEMMNMIGLAKLRLVHLEDAAHKLPSELSGGMQKRAALARALALDPPIVFLDEPSAGLDPVTSAGLDRLVLDLRELLGTTFVVVTHELPSIYAMARRVVLLDASRRGIVAIGTPQELRDSRERLVSDFFNRRARESVVAAGGPADTEPRGLP